jgi:hypothetical protein
MEGPPPVTNPSGAQTRHPDTAAQNDQHAGSLSPPQRYCCRCAAPTHYERPRSRQYFAGSGCTRRALSPLCTACATEHYVAVLQLPLGGAQRSTRAPTGGPTAARLVLSWRRLVFEAERPVAPWSPRPLVSTCTGAPRRPPLLRQRHSCPRAQRMRRRLTADERRLDSAGAAVSTTSSSSSSSAQARARTHAQRAQ